MIVSNERADKDVQACADIPADPVIEAYKRDVDRTLIRYFLQLTPEQRLLSLEKSLEDAVELQRAGKMAMRR